MTDKTTVVTVIDIVKGVAGNSPYNEKCLFIKIRFNTNYMSQDLNNIITTR